MDKDQENNTAEKKRGRGEEEAAAAAAADDGDKKRVKVDVVPAVEVEVEEKPENVGPKCDCGIVVPREVAKKAVHIFRAGTASSTPLRCVRRRVYLFFPRLTFAPPPLKDDLLPPACTVAENTAIVVVLKKIRCAGCTIAI